MEDEILIIDVNDNGINVLSVPDVILNFLDLNSNGEILVSGGDPLTITSENIQAAVTLDLNTTPLAALPVSYTFSQSTPSDTWNINHNLGFRPLVQLYNSGSQEVEGNIIHLSNNQVMVYFETPISGYARLI